VRTLTVVVTLALSLLGCPPSGEKGAEKKAPMGPCAKLGDSCEFSPGKLGTCVVLDDCKAPPCFKCQSQH